VLTSIFIVVLIGFAGVYMRDHIDHKPKSLVNKLYSSTACTSSGNYTATNGNQDTLRVIVEFGSQSEGGEATHYALLTNQKTLSASQYTYSDGGLGSTSTTSSCSMSNINSSSVIVTCGMYSFSLALE
jgi:hypothetical protein